MPFLAGRLADWLWYRETGFERVFLTKVVAQWALGIPTALVAFAFLYGNARVALRGDPRRVRSPVSQVGPGAELRNLAHVLVTRGLGSLTIPVCALLAVFVALGAAGEWRTLLQAMYGTPFGVTDAVFGRDVGYYVFTLPAIEMLAGLLFGLLVITLDRHRAPDPPRPGRDRALAAWHLRRAAGADASRRSWPGCCCW